LRGGLRSSLKVYNEKSIGRLASTNPTHGKSPVELMKATRITEKGINQEKRTQSQSKPDFDGDPLSASIGRSTAKGCWRIYPKWLLPGKQQEAGESGRLTFPPPRKKAGDEEKMGGGNSGRNQADRRGGRNMSIRQRQKSCVDGKTGGRDLV